MSRCGKILTAVSVFDLLISAILIESGSFGEANFVLAWYLERWGIVGLAAAKIWLTGWSIFLLETIWRRRLRVSFDLIIKRPDG